MLLSTLALLLALAADYWLGEPRAHWHPVVWMGRYLGWAGRRTAPFVPTESQPPQRLVASDPDFKAFIFGTGAWVAGAAVVCIASWLLQKGLLAASDSLGPIAGVVVAALLLGLALKPMLAWSMLRSEVLSVERSLSAEHGGSLTAGRERLSWLVSRNVTQLSETQVRESAIESLAENLSDSVVAPIFWFVLLGLPGAALYRFSNTADAMWGYHGVYRGQDWEWAGKWAARADDVLSWVPARITAFMLLCLRWPQKNSDVSPGPLAAAQGMPAQGSLMARLRDEAHRTPSPNSGWPMAAMALSLGLCLHKPGVYVLNETGRAPQMQDMQRAVAHASKVVLAMVCTLLTVAAVVIVGRLL